MLLKTENMIELLLIMKDEMIVTVIIKLKVKYY